MSDEQHKSGDIKWRGVLMLLIVLFIAIAIGGLLIFLSFVNEGNHGAIYNIGQPSIQSLGVAISFIMVGVGLIGLPIFMVTSYTQVQVKEIEEKIRTTLNLGKYSERTGHDRRHLEKDYKDKLDTFKMRNAFGAFVWPLVIMTIALGLHFLVLFMPRGLEATYNALIVGGPVRYSSGEIPRFIFSPDIYLNFLITFSTPITWAFLGAYFYGITTLTRRWMRTDLTVGFFWRLTARMVIILVIGLLLMLIWPLLGSEQNSTQSVSVYSLGGLLRLSGVETNRALMVVAFLAGIAPDIVLDWIIRRFQSLVDLNVKGVFSPSDVHKKIDGLNFWKADRLFEQGIESVRDLAKRDLTDLLINTRYDSQQLIDWVDQAVLVCEVDEKNLISMDCFRAVGVNTASDLLDIWCDEIDQKERQKRFIQTLDFAYKAKVSAENVPDETVMEALVENIVNNIQVGANIGFIRNYWHNVAAPVKSGPVPDTE